jgi:hypothetical protein
VSKRVLFSFQVILFCTWLSIAASADCGGNKRFMIVVQNPNLVVGDTWAGNGGVIATPSMCGGCAIVNFPGGSYNDSAYPLTASIEWGDGTSSPLTIRPGDGALLGSHQYNQPVQGAIKVTLSGHCVNPQRNWDEKVDTICSTWAGNNVCDPHPASVSVFSPMQPTSISGTTTPITHGRVTPGGLALFLDSSAPASGMTMKVWSANARVKFAMPGQPSTNPAYIIIPAGNSAFNFDIDTTLLRAGAAITINAVNRNDPQVAKTKNVRLQIQ